MPLFRIEMTAFKTFYVEATNQESALKADVVDDEQHVSGGDVDWEHNETSASQLTEQQAFLVRKTKPGSIRK